METRGIARNRRFAEQGRDFSGLRYGSITPTDIDAGFDFQNRAFVFIEAKYHGVGLPLGQRLFIERLCDVCNEAGRASLALIVSHQTPPDQQVDYATCVVAEFRFRREWRVPTRRLLTRDAIDHFLEMAGLNYRCEPIAQVADSRAEILREWEREGLPF
jgi:hypothetical protein